MDAFSIICSRPAPGRRRACSGRKGRNLVLGDLGGTPPRLRLPGAATHRSIRLAQGTERCRSGCCGPPTCHGDARLHALLPCLPGPQPPGAALHHAQLAVRHNPAMWPFVRPGQRAHVAGAGRRLRVAGRRLHCRYPYDEQLFCFTASALNLPEPMLAMLRLGKRRSPDRVPTLYNLALALLAQGKTEEAVAHLHRCRDLDPEDVTALFMTQAVTGWREMGFTREEHAQAGPQASLLPPAALHGGAAPAGNLGPGFGPGAARLCGRPVPGWAAVPAIPLRPVLPQRHLGPLFVPRGHGFGQTGPGPGGAPVAGCAAASVPRRR